MDAAKLEALDGLVTEVDGEAPGVQAEAARQAQAEVDAVDAADAAARSWAMIAYTIGGGLSLIAPELRQAYTEDACMTWGRAMVPVAEKYGWDSPGNMPELGLVMVTLPLAVPSVLAVRERIRQAREQKAAALRAGAAARGEPVAPAAPAATVVAGDGG